MSAQDPTPDTGNNPATRQRPIPDHIDYVFDHGTEGDVTANAEVKGNDFTQIIGDWQTDTNEVIEVYKVEMIPPKNADTATTDPGALQSFEALRLWDGSAYYPHVRFREFMMSMFGPNENLTTPALGTPVLSGQANPATNPIASAVPKFGPSTPVTPVLINNGDAITDSFRIRLHTWRFKGSDQELQNWFQSTYGQTQFQQNIRMSNPFTGRDKVYGRGNATSITANASGGARGQFTKLTGGPDQELPKVYPWVSWTTNAQATRANRPYQFTTANDRVSEPWQALEYDLTNERDAVWMDYLQVSQHANLQEGEIVIEERDHNPSVHLGDNDAHELPIFNPTDGAGRPNHDDGQLPVELEDRLGSKQVIWSDGGGFRVLDNGTSIPAGELLIGVQGHYLELTT